jgi:hypothetical protein
MNKLSKRISLLAIGIIAALTLTGCSTPDYGDFVIAENRSDWITNFDDQKATQNVRLLADLFLRMDMDYSELDKKAIFADRNFVVTCLKPMDDATYELDFTITNLKGLADPLFQADIEAKTCSRETDLSPVLMGILETMSAGPQMNYQTEAYEATAIAYIIHEDGTLEPVEVRGSAKELPTTYLPTTRVLTADEELVYATRYNIAFK